MKSLHLLALSAPSLLLILASVPAAAQHRPAGLGPRITLPAHSNHFSWERGHGFNHRLRGGFGGVWIVERPFGYAQDREVPVIVEKEVVVVKEAPPPPAAVPLPQNSGGGEKARKPYVIGSTYASLPPQGCMKMIESGANYYYCSGEWYREVRSGRDPLYRAVARKL